MKLLIVGIDPGTTTAYSILDIDGNPLKSRSGKDMSFNEMVSILLREGKLLAVASDKAKTPSFVEEIAVKFGAKIITPDEDLKVEEKRELIKNFSISNNHEKDSLASALFAYMKIEPLLIRIKRFVKENKKENFLNEIIELVVIKKLNMHAALRFIEHPESEESTIVQKILSRKPHSEEEPITRGRSFRPCVFENADFVALYNKLSAAEEENFFLRKKNKALLHSNENLAEFIARLKNKDNKLIHERILEKTGFRQKNFFMMQEQLKNLEQEKKELEKLNSFIAAIGDFVVLKKLKNLGLEEFHIKCRRLNIQKGDVLLVEDVSAASSKVMGQLEGKVGVIVCKSKTNKALPFMQIPSSKLNAEEIGNFAFVKKDDFLKCVDNYQLLDKIIEQHRSRNNP